ncbi:MAG: 4-hydroxy-tetrahydrodipicolinate reductase [Christensenellales bacterium]|jgi:4-hydroxy-tetrahydrodipicolinate reductase
MNIILQGYGRMGRNIEAAMAEFPEMRIVGAVHPGLFARPQDVPGDIDAIIDFSYPGNLKNMLDYARDTGCALVVGTTGYSAEQLDALRAAGAHAPVMYSANYSLGVAVMKRAAAMLAQALMSSGFDCEIVEKHHAKKADAPSGTAMALLKAIDPDDSYRHVFGRAGITGARGREIGIGAIRGGTAPGEHSVLFLGQDEELEIKHTALSRSIFARGAVRAARAMAGARKGFYTMDDLFDL